MGHPTQNQAAEAKAAHVSPSHYHNDKEQVSAAETPTVPDLRQADMTTASKETKRQRLNRSVRAATASR